MTGDRKSSSPLFVILSGWLGRAQIEPVPGVLTFNIIVPGRNLGLTSSGITVTFFEIFLRS
jgi:hypothetical protein